MSDHLLALKAENELFRSQFATLIKQRDEMANACNALLERNEWLETKGNERVKFLNERLISISENYNELNKSSKRRISMLEDRIEKIEAQKKKLRKEKKEALEKLRELDA
jgi:hypothetical protein